MVAITQDYGLLALSQHACIFSQRCLLDYAALGGKYKVVAIDIFLIVQTLAGYKDVDLVIRLDIEQVLQGATLAVLGSFGQFEHSHLVYKATTCEEQHSGVHRSRIYVFYEVFFTRIAALGTDAATILSAEFAQRGALDISEMRDGDNHIIVCIEVLGIEIAGGVVDVCAALVTVFFFDFLEVGYHHSTTFVFVIKDELQLGCIFAKRISFVFQLVLLKGCEVA